MRDRTKFLLIAMFASILLLASILLFTSLLLQGEIQPVEYIGNVGDVLWVERSMDVLVQVLIIFTGVLGVLALKPEAKK